MNLPPINLPTTSLGESLTPETLPAAVRGWQVGQILQATVVQRTTPESATLRFGNQEVAVQTRIPLTAGQSLQVRVDTVGPIITLRLHGTAPPEGMTPSEAMRAALPHQQSLAPLLANLSRLMSTRSAGPETTPRTSSPLPPAIGKIVQQLFDAFPEIRRMVTPEGVRQAIRDSGTFTEPRLAEHANRGATPASGDTKLNLVRLLDALHTLMRAAPPPEGALTTRPSPHSIAPPLRHQPPLAQARAQPTIIQLLDQNASLIRIVQELATQIEGALARIQVSQLSSLPTDGPSQVWVAEVPVRHEQQSDLFQFRIEHRRAGRGENSDCWSITFAFELEELGPVRARVMLYQQELSATLWVERETTADKFRTRLTQLRERIEQHGLPVRNIDCLTGIPQTDSSSPGPGLIDEQA